MSMYVAVVPLLARPIFHNLTTLCVVKAYQPYMLALSCIVVRIKP
jgi:hypothetical protein